MLKRERTRGPGGCGHSRSRSKFATIFPLKTHDSTFAPCPLKIAICSVKSPQTHTIPRITYHPPDIFIENADTLQKILQEATKEHNIQRHTHEARAPGPGVFSPLLPSFLEGQERH
jgi:hypothetical protein